MVLYLLLSLLASATSLKCIVPSFVEASIRTGAKYNNFFFWLKRYFFLWHVMCNFCIQWAYNKCYRNYLYSVLYGWRQAYLVLSFRWNLTHWQCCSSSVPTSFPLPYIECIKSCWIFNLIVLYFFNLNLVYEYSLLFLIVLWQIPFLV